MIAYRPLRPIYVALAVLLSTIFCLKSQQQKIKDTLPEGLENGMTDASQLEYRWARPLEGRPEYTFVAYDPKNRDIVGEVSFSATVNIDEVQMSEEWRNRGAFTELLRQMLQNIQRDKLKIKKVIHETLNGNFPDDFIDLYEEAGFTTGG
ncbi:hypothetical protein FOZ62_024856, partial [Perkinsus olseni]